jgi:hypothetical protein
MIVCETYFEDPDPKRPSYSAAELDFYSHTPFDTREKVPNHRLSLRKNLRTGQYEAFRVYLNPTTLLSLKGLTVIAEEEGKIVQILHCTFSLQAALDFCNAQSTEFWHDMGDKDELCQHRPPKVAMHCKRRYEQ